MDNAPQQRKDEWNSPVVGAILIILLTVVAYLPVMRGGFVWDDGDWTTHIPALLRDVSGLRSMWCQPTALQQYFPLSGTTFWVDYHLWGFWPPPYHVENVLLHILAALLFWRVLRRLQVPGAWLAGAIFALHPVMVESVAWITERKNVLSLVLYLGALLAYGRFNSFWKEDNGSPVRHGGAYALALLLCLGALLAKTTAFSLPAVIVLIGWWKCGRVRWREDVLPTLPMFALAFKLCQLTAWLEKTRNGAQGPHFALTFPERCLIAGRATWFYIGKLLWPANICFAYSHWQPDVGSWQQWLYPAAAAVVLVALWLARSRIGRGPVTAAFFYVGTLFPLLGFFNAFAMLYSFVWNHWVYLPSLGPIALVAALAARAAVVLRAPRVFDGVVAVVLVALGMLTWEQVGGYQDNETLWQRSLRTNPSSYLAQSNLAATLFQKAQAEDVVGHHQDALRHYEDSLVHDKLALQLRPDLPDPYRNVASALGKLGRLKEAAEYCEQAVRIKPDDPYGRYCFGTALLKVGNTSEAIKQFEVAVFLAPDSVEQHNNLGLALSQAGRVPEAILQYEWALRINPNVAMIHDNLANALLRLGRVQEAVQHYNQALRITPDYPEALNDLAWLLATREPEAGGDPIRAVALAERACQLTNHQVAWYLDTLAAAYAAAGRFSDAITTAEQAVELTRAGGQPRMAGQIESRLQLYRGGQAYREPTAVMKRPPAN